MKTMGSFQHELNEMFGEINQASSIVIGFNAVKHGKPLTGQNAIRLVSVNGFKSFGEFAAAIAHMQDHLIGKIIEFSGKLDLRDKRALLLQAIGCSRRLIYFTLPVSQPANACHPTRLRAMIFKAPSFTCNGTGAVPGDETRECLLRLTRRYAWLWQMHAEDLIQELCCFLYQVEFWPALSTAGNNITSIHEKIPVNGNVSALAALSRLFFEHKAIALDNKSKFCRLVADMFCTPKQPQISPKSLKNHFDSPSPETIDFICAELRKMMNKSRNLTL